MTTPARLLYDPSDPRHLLHCANPPCWKQRAKFRYGSTMLVDLELTASSIMMIVKPDRTHEEFKRGGAVESLRCANCGTAYPPHCGYDSADR